MQNIVALCASPRAGMPEQKSLTEELLNYFLEGLKGPRCQVFYPHKMNINYCEGCLTCWFKTPGTCAQDDDMATIKSAMEEADLVILASPLYTDGFSSQIKTVLDRCISMVDPLIISDEEGHSRHNPLIPKKRKAVLVSTCGFPELDNFEQIQGHFRAICKNLFWEHAGEILVPGSALGFIKGYYEEKFQAVKQAGMDLQEQGRISSLTEKEISKEIVSTREYQEIVNPFFQKLRDQQQ